MSDYYIHVIPKDPRFVPTEGSIVQAKALMAEVAPAASKITSEITETIRFCDCGGNFEGIHCPACDAELSTDWWHEQLDDDYQEGGFTLKPIRTPCAHEVNSLNDLTYKSDQGFSRFVLSMLNANIGGLGSDRVEQLEAILSCAVKVVYQRV